MDADALAKAFVTHYYTTFDTNRASLYTLYQESSMLTFEGEKFMGQGLIQQKISNLPFQQCKHVIGTVDSQPSVSGGTAVFVSGSLQLGDQEHSLRFSQMFILMPTAQGSFYVHNDMFRLNYG